MRQQQYFRAVRKRLRCVMVWVGAVSLLGAGVVGCGPCDPSDLACQCKGDNQDKCVSPNKERSLAGTFRSDSGRIAVFQRNRTFQFYLNGVDFQQNQPFIELNYVIVGQLATFTAEDGTEEQAEGQFSEDDRSFTWEKFPDDTFVLSDG